MEEEGFVIEEEGLCDGMDGNGRWGEDEGVVEGRGVRKRGRVRSHDRLGGCRLRWEGME